MSRPEFENQVMISAVSSKSQRFVEQKSTTPLGNFQFERFNIFASPGKTGRLLNFQMKFAPIAGGVAGDTKTLIIDCMIDGSRGLGMFQIAGTFDSNLLYDQGTPKNHATMNPSDLGGLANQIDRIVFDDERAMQVVFGNFSVSTTAERSFILFIEEEVTSR